MHLGIELINSPDTKRATGHDGDSAIEIMHLFFRTYDWVEYGLHGERI